MSNSPSIPAPMADERVSKLAETAFEHYHRNLHEFLVRRLPRSEDAADVMQEVFLRLLGLPDSDFVRNPQAYLYGIASRVLHEMRKKARYERVTFDSDAVDERTENPPFVAADEFAEGISAQRQVERSLGQLTPIQLQVLVARCRDGLSHQEIAQKMGLSVHTVKKYSAHALALVRSDWHRSRSAPSHSEGPDDAA